MPYISKECRERFDKQIEDIASKIQSKGELTYCLYKLVFMFCRPHDKLSKYADISNVIACLNDAEHELRRQVLDPYEDKKIEENGRID